MQALKEQILASNPASSVWVSANAGTGKTKILTDRYLRLMLEGAELEKIICITYTKAAANEMKERILSMISKWTIMEEKDLRESFSSIIGTTPDDGDLAKARTLYPKLIDNPEKLKIQTIHSLCQSILKRFPIEAEIQPYFQVMDENSQKEMVGKLYNNVIKFAFTEEGKSSDEVEIRETILSLNSNIGSFTTRKNNRFDIL